MVGPGQGLGLVVDQEHPVGVAVEGEADVGPHLEHPGLEVLEVLGLDGVGRVVGEAAVELGVHQLDVERKALEHLGGHQSPHAVAGVGHHLERTEHRAVDERPHVVAELVQQVEGADRPVPAASGGLVGPTSLSTMAWMSRRPVSWPTGRAPGRHSLIPLYLAGLWEAVSMAAGASRLPAA